jgi:DNA-binding GntR family transcriptional regulator
MLDNPLLDEPPAVSHPAQGLVELVPRLGAQVARVGADDVRELYACRTLLEPRCTALAVEALTPDDLLELDELRASMELAVAEGDPRRFLTWRIFARLPRYGEGSLAQHAVLHDAVRAGDGEAAERADRTILERALRAILDTFEHTTPEAAGA